MIQNNRSDLAHCLLGLTLLPFISVRNDCFKVAKGKDMRGFKVGDGSLVDLYDDLGEFYQHSFVLCVEAFAVLL